jgi:hypothetical protein
MESKMKNTKRQISKTKRKILKRRFVKLCKDVGTLPTGILAVPCTKKELQELGWWDKEDADRRDEYWNEWDEMAMEARKI